VESYYKESGLLTGGYGFYWMGLRIRSQMLQEWPKFAWVVGSEWPPSSAAGLLAGSVVEVLSWLLGTGRPWLYSCSHSAPCWHHRLGTARALQDWVRIAGTDDVASELMHRRQCYCSHCAMRC
jgi:hypothetical protein